MASLSRKRECPEKEENDDRDQDEPPKKKVRRKHKSKKAKKKRKAKKKFKYHSGNLVVDWDAETWADEYLLDQVNSNMYRREYPDGFTWNCCDKRGDESGCSERSRPATPLSEKYATSPEPLLDESEFYHCGCLDVDWDFDVWGDTDEEIHGRINTKTNRIKFPKGFKWSCCGKIGTFAEGCTRIEEKEQDDDDEDDDYFIFLAVSAMTRKHI